MGKTFLEVLFKPAWKWWVSMPLEIIGILAFLNPDWGSYLTLPSLSKVLPWYVFVIVGLIVLLLATAWEAAKRIHEKETRQAQPSTRFTQTSRRDAYQAARDQYITPAPEIVPPNIYAGVLSRQDHTLDEKVVFHLRPLPPKPDFDELVNKERSRLLQKKQRAERNSRGVEKTVQDTMNTIYGLAETYNYSERVEEYLPRYRAYETEVYNFSIIGDRYKVLEMALQCRGMSPASLVVLELHFPEYIQFPPVEIAMLHDEIRRREGYSGGYKPHRPKEPDLLVSPKLMSHRMMGMDAMDAYADNNQIAPELKGDYEISKRSGVNVIVYKVQDLIQNHLYTDLVPIHIWLDNFEHSTVITVPVKIYSKDLKDSPVERTLEIELIVEEQGLS